MIKGLMMTPPVVGRISIGRVVERNGKRLPEKDDEFTITTQVQSRNGWMLHPMDGILRRELEDRQLVANGVEVKELAHLPEEFSAPAQAPATLRSKLAKRATDAKKTQAVASSSSNAEHDNVHEDASSKTSTARTKLRSIPVKVLFNDPDLNFRAEYAMFDRRTGRPVCVGNGESCKRRTESGIQSLPCPSPEGCTLAQNGACKPYGRLNVLIGDDDPLGSFVFRTTGFNSIRTLSARLAYFQAISGNRLAYLPLELRLRGKSTRQSMGTPIYYVDLTVRSGVFVEDALTEAKRLEADRQEAGFEQVALETAARQGFSNGAFEESDEEGDSVVEEFYPEGDGASENAKAASTGFTEKVAQFSLVNKLDDRAAKLASDVG